MIDTGGTSAPALASATRMRTYLICPLFRLPDGSGQIISSCLHCLNAHIIVI